MSKMVKKNKSLNLLVNVVPASCIVKLSDDEMEKQVDKMVAKGGQAVHKVVEPGSKYLCIGSLISLFWGYLNERTVRGL